MDHEASSQAEPLTIAGDAGARDTCGETAADRVVRDHADLVYSLARRLTRNEDEAHDLFQEAFVRILKGLPAFEGRSSLKTWICQVVINCDRNRRRWWGRLRRNLPSVSLEREAQGEDVPAIDPADPAAGPERLAMSREVRGRVEASLLALPREQRTAILLRDAEGLSYEEIAAAMGIAVGTVKSRIARARSSLRERLADLVEGAGSESAT